MASGSAGRANSGSKGFDFGSDDILCTYDDFANKDSSNGGHSDAIGTNSSKDFHKTRMARSPAYPASSYNQPEDSFNPDMITVVERTMKKHNDNLMRFLEGISSRLSQLELHCYNLDKSIGEMRSDLGRDHGEADTKLKTLEKHIQEVHRSVQILRDKQELADTQKELAKLQLVHKESSSPSHSQSEEKSSPPSSDSKKPENISEIHNNQLAIDLPHKILPPQQPAPVPQTQQQSYYMPPLPQLPNPPAQAQHHQAQYMTPDPQYQTPLAPQPVQPQMNQAPQGQQFPQYQQQWPQQPTVQPQMRPSSPSVYPTYPPPSQPANSSPSETQPMPQPSSMPMQMPYTAVPQSKSNYGADTMPYGYGASRIPQQPGPKGNYGADGYPPAVPHSALPPGSAYMMYDTEGGRPTHNPPPQQGHFPQGGYPPPSLSLQTPQPAGGANMLPRNPTHYVPRNHPYSELVEKLVSMGFRGDQVMSVIQRMDESGQPVDFNAVLDRLSASSGGSQRGGWSG